MRAGWPKRGAAAGIDRAAAFHRRGVDQHHVVIEPRAVVGEQADQPIDRLGRATATLPIPGLAGQPRKQVPQAPARDREKLAVRRDVHDRLRNSERDDLRIGHAAPGVSCPIGQEIVSGNEHRDKQQVEVGEHRGPQGRRRKLSTADFDSVAISSYSTLNRVESTI